MSLSYLKPNITGILGLPIKLVIEMMLPSLSLACKMQILSRLA